MDAKCGSHENSVYGLKVLTVPTLREIDIDTIELRAFECARCVLNGSGNNCFRRFCFGKLLANDLPVSTATGSFIVINVYFYPLCKAQLLRGIQNNCYQIKS